MPGTDPAALGRDHRVSRVAAYRYIGEAVEPGSVHDLTAARIHVLGALYAAAADDLSTVADLGYEGTGIGVFTPVKQPSGSRVRDADTRTYNALLRAPRCLAERGAPCSPNAGASCNTSPPALAE